MLLNLCTHYCHYKVVCSEVLWKLNSLLKHAVCADIQLGKECARYAMLCYAMTLPQEWTEAWYLALTICIELNMICYAAP